MTPCKLVDGPIFFEKPTAPSLEHIYLADVSIRHLQGVTIYHPTCQNSYDCYVN